MSPSAQLLTLKLLRLQKLVISWEIYLKKLILNEAYKFDH